MLWYHTFQRDAVMHIWIGLFTLEVGQSEGGFSIPAIHGAEEGKQGCILCDQEASPFAGSQREGL